MRTLNADYRTDTVYRRAVTIPVRTGGDSRTD